MALSTVTALVKLFGQYLLQPLPFTLICHSAEVVIGDDK